MEKSTTYHLETPSPTFPQHSKQQCTINNEGTPNRQTSVLLSSTTHPRICYDGTDSLLIRSQIPIAISLDLLFKRSVILESGRVLGLNLLGAALILTGFFGINMGGWSCLDSALARLGWRHPPTPINSRLQD
jgi:hypothetical protein